MSKPRIVALPGIVHADGLVERTRHIATFEQKYAVVDMCPKLGGAAIVGAAAPKYFFAPNGGWNAGNIVKPTLSYEDLSSITMDYIIPALTDNGFKASPLLKRLRNPNPSRFSGGNMPIQFERLGR